MIWKDDNRPSIFYKRNYVINILILLNQNNASTNQYR